MCSRNTYYVSVRHVFDQITLTIITSRMTNQHPIKRCSTCTLIPLILGLSGLIALYWVAKENKAEFIQNDLSIKSNYLLSELKVGGVVVIFDGRDAVLTGEVESSKRAGEIESIIASIDGTRTLNNQLIIKIVGEQSSLQAVVSKSKVQNTSKPFNKVEQESSAQVDSPKNELQHDINTLDLSEITFLFGSDEISEQGKAILNNIAQKLKENEEFCNELGVGDLYKEYVKEVEKIRKTGELP